MPHCIPTNAAKKRSISLGKISNLKISRTSQWVVWQWNLANFTKTFKGDITGDRKRYAAHTDT